MSTLIDVSDLDKNITFGKYKGETWRHILVTNPDYLIWVDENVDFIEFSEEVYAKIEKVREKKVSETDYYKGWGGWQNADDAGVFGDLGE